jgi:hypothetical protein
MKYYTPNISEFTSGFKYQVKASNTIGTIITFDFGSGESKEISNIPIKEVWISKEVPNLNKDFISSKYGDMTISFVFNKKEYLNKIENLLKNGEIRAKVLHPNN